MNDTKLRQQIHQAVNAYGAGLRENPFLAQRVLSQTHGKESPIMKRKLSAGTILLIILLLASMTALAVGITLSVEDMWQQSFDKMNTTGEIRNLSDETTAEITMEEAIAIARSAIIAKFGTPEAELDAMGVYPTYAARGWDGKTDDYPSEWEVFFSSRTDVELDLDHTDYGPTGEYLVYINAETREVDTCIWYTNDFWSRAQTVWDCGSYDEVYWWYGQTSFYEQPIEQQLYWEQQLASQGYKLALHSAKYKALLKTCYLNLLHCDPDLALDASSDAQVAAAWDMVQRQYGFDAGLLQKYCFIATRSAYQTGTEDIILSWNYPLSEEIRTQNSFRYLRVQPFNDVRRVGTFLVSFDPGTTHCVGVTHLWHTKANPELRRITKGKLLEQTDWGNDDLIAFDAAYEELLAAMQRMDRVGAHTTEMNVVCDAAMRALGGDPKLYDYELEGYDVRRWFSDETAPTSTPVPSITKAEAQEKYGRSPIYWPVEVRYELQHFSNGWLTVPQEGELTQEEAQEIALQLVVERLGQSALDELGDYRIGCTLTRFGGDYGKEVTQWEFYIRNDERDEENGWYVRFIDKNREDYGDGWAEIRPFAEVGLG